MKKRFIAILLLIAFTIIYKNFVLGEQHLESTRVPRGSISVKKELDLKQNSKEYSDFSLIITKKRKNALERKTDFVKIKEEFNLSENSELNFAENQLEFNNKLEYIEKLYKDKDTKYNIESSSQGFTEELVKENSRKPGSRIGLINQIKKHRVENGETLWDIAQKHNVDLDTLIGANDINNINKIKPGQTIKVLPVKGILYKISPGENLSSITDKFNISLNKIIASNLINNPNRVQPGDTLILPGAKPEFGYRDRLEKVFTKPVYARISSYFGRRWGRMHEGIDYAAPSGSKVKASGEGRVVYSGWARGYGKTIIIEHQKGMRTLYAHNSKLIVNTGDRVSKGDLIAKSGNTGNTTGPNVHFEVQVNGRPVDPLSYI